MESLFEKYGKRESRCFPGCFLIDNLEELEKDVKFLKDFKNKQFYLIESEKHFDSKKVECIENLSVEDVELLCQDPNFKSSIKHEKYSTYNSRLESFEKWTSDNPIKKEDLAKAGFFYLGRDDCTRCFCCGVSLKNWKGDDFPVIEHAKYKPSCKYLEMLLKK